MAISAEILEKYQGLLAAGYTSEAAEAELGITLDSSDTPVEFKISDVDAFQQMLQQAKPMALSVLTEIMNDRSIADAVRVNAARAVLTTELLSEQTEDDAGFEFTKRLLKAGKILNDLKNNAVQAVSDSKAQPLEILV